MQASGNGDETEQTEKLCDLAKQTGNLKSSLRTLANYWNQIKQVVCSRVTTAWNWNGFNFKFKLLRYVNKIIQSKKQIVYNVVCVCYI